MRPHFGLGDAAKVEQRDARVRGGSPKAGPGQDEHLVLGQQPADLVDGHAVRDELRVDAALADTARDQLRVLAAEVEHQHRPLLRALLGLGERDDLRAFRHERR